MLDAFGQPEDRRRHLVAHLDEVVQGHVGDRLGVLAAARLEQRQRPGPRAAGVVQAAVQLDHVLEGSSWRPARRTGRWRARRRRAAPYAREPARAALHRAEHADRVVQVVVHQVRRQRRQRPGSARAKCASIRRGSVSASKRSGPLGQKSVQVKDRSGFGSAIIIDVPRGQMCSAPASSANSPSTRRDRQLLVAVVEEVHVLRRRCPRRAAARAPRSRRRRPPAPRRPRPTPSPAGVANTIRPACDVQLHQPVLEVRPSRPEHPPPQTAERCSARRG